MKTILGRRGDYAVRAVLELSRHWGNGRRKSREIAQVMSIPRKYLPQILASLVRAELLSASAGRDGGYELRRPPRDISLLDVIEAVEPAAELTECVLRGGACQYDGVCAFHEHWLAAQLALSERLAATTLAELAQQDLELRQSR